MREGLPGFTAQSTLYVSKRRYRAAARSDSPTPAGSVVAALTAPDQSRCDACINNARERAADCTMNATATWLAGLASCAVFGPFAPLCAIPVTTGYAIAEAYCLGKLAVNEAECRAGADCCPQRCPQGHCCSDGETCITSGCCPKGNTVCSDRCCNAGDYCCGGNCCPAGYFCRDGQFCEKDFIGEFPKDPPPKPPLNPCLFGGEPCGGKCCPPGLQCCGVFNGQPDCKTSCLH